MPPVAVQHIHLLLCLNIGCEIRHHQIRIAALFADTVQHLVEGMLIAVAVFTAFQLFQYCVQHLIFLPPFHRVVAFGQNCLHLFHGMTKNKDIFFTDFLGDFNVRTIQRTDSKRTIERQFHIAGTGSFFTCSRNLFGDIRRRDQFFRRRNAIIRQEHHLQLIANQWIVVDHVSHFVDRKDNILRRSSPVPLSRRRGRRAVRDQPAGFHEFLCTTPEYAADSGAGVCTHADV